MVAHVLLAQLLAGRRLRDVMVKVVVGVVVGQVAGDEAREEGIGRGGPEDQGEQPEEQGRERDADRRRHDQPERIVRVVVVDAVDDEVEPAAERVVGLPVEDEPVQPVLGERPDQQAGEEQAGDLEDAVAAVEARATAPTTTTGTKMIAGTDGWTREKKSRNRLSNSGGEALS